MAGGYFGIMFQVCDNCFEKMSLVQNGQLPAESLITKGMSSDLDQYIRGLENGSTDISSAECGTESSSKRSGIGYAIKVVSVIVLVLATIGSIIIMKENIATGLVYLLLSILFGLLCFGIGEICTRLASIDEKMK